MNVDASALKAEWVGRPAFDHNTFTINADDLVEWANACGETDPRYTDPSHPDFQAHPGFTCALVSRRSLPDNFPEIGRSVDGGKRVESLAPIRPGDVLDASSEIADVYDKTGRSGTMVFIVHRMTYRNQQGEPVSTVDWRMIRNVVKEG